MSSKRSRGAPTRQTPVQSRKRSLISVDAVLWLGKTLKSEAGAVINVVQLGVRKKSDCSFPRWSVAITELLTRHKNSADSAHLEL